MTRLLAVCAVAVCSASGTASGADVSADFNGDGFADLAVGVPGDTVLGSENAGSVIVLYAPGAAPDPRYTQIWNQDTAGVPGRAEPNDRFGTALAAGDFDDDGFADLAIGAPGEEAVDCCDSGASAVLRGGGHGLSASGARLMALLAPPFSYAGRALAAGDFDGDGVDDLAVGAPGFGGDSGPRTGAVFGLRGSRLSGLSSLAAWRVRSSYWNGSNGVGFSLAAGDFDGDRIDDLAIGAPGEDIGASGLSGFDGGTHDAGSVSVRYGTSEGIPESVLPTAGSRIQFFWQDDGRVIRSVPKRDDRFSEVLVAADFDGSGTADLAVGVPRGDCEPRSFSPRGSGEVHVIYSLQGLGLVRARFGTQAFCQDSPGIGGSAEYEDNFGGALAGGDFRGDGRGDLAIGVPGEDVPTRHRNVRDAGAVFVIEGTRYGLDVEAGSYGFDQRLVGGSEGLEANDYFGRILGSDDFNGDGRQDLAIGSPFENLKPRPTCPSDDSVSFLIFPSPFFCSPLVDAGLVTVFFGWQTNPFLRTRFNNYSRLSPGMTGSPNLEEIFGAALNP